MVLARAFDLAEHDCAEVAGAGGVALEIIKPGIVQISFCDAFGDFGALLLGGRLSFLLLCALDLWF